MAASAGLRRKRTKHETSPPLSERIEKELVALADSTYEDDERFIAPETVEFARRLVCAFVEHGFREPDSLGYYQTSCATAASFGWWKAKVDTMVAFDLAEPSVTLLIPAESVSCKWTSDDLGTPISHNAVAKLVSKALRVAGIGKL
jgi:hypothetical protein